MKIVNLFMLKSEENKNYLMVNKVLYIYGKNGWIKHLEKKEILWNILLDGDQKKNLNKKKEREIWNYNSF